MHADIIAEVTLGIIGAVGLLLVFGLPLAFVTGLIALLLAYGFFGTAGVGLISSRVYSFVTQYVFISVPMFVLMAAIMDRSGIARDLYDAMSRVTRRIRGGVALQTIVVAVFLAAMSGIIGGEIVLLGMLALPQMLRLGYDDRLAIGVVCAGGALGTMVPPSIVLIIYGLIAQVSVSDLFAAALIPALILAGSYAAYIIIRVNLDPSLAPAIEDVLNDQNEESGNVTLIGVLLPVLVAFMVLGSIYGGIASVTESASLGAAGMILSTIVRREFTWTLLRDSLRQTLQTCGMIIWIGIGASALIGVYSLLGGIKFVEQTLLGLDLAPVALILAMMGLLIILGLFLDWVGIALLTMPVFLPIIKTLGYDPVWFGILFCINMQVSFLSPPFGPAAFFLKSVAPPEITLGRIFSSLWPFILIQVAVLLLVLFVPEITEILR
jgi:tripartite ATP-independent transporter DctM subunit